MQFDWSIKTSRLGAAHEALPAIRKALDGLLAVTTQKRYAQFVDAEYWKKMARLAELEGKAQDAAEYRRAADNAKNAPVRVEDMSEPSRAKGKQLPPFTATGIDGRVWTGADLQGKVAVMSVWATWCGPCVEELTHLQTLYETLKHSPDVIVISLNIDANPGVVEPFLKGRHLTFPVLLAHDYVNRILPEMSIPRNWIVESGIVRDEDVGFDIPDTWMKRMLAKVEEAGQRR